MNSRAAMNRIYRLACSHARQMWAPVAETSRGRLAAALLHAAGPALAELPTRGSISSGSINSNGTDTAVTQQ